MRPYWRRTPEPESNHMVKTKPVSDDLTDHTETLITEFIEFWEAHWSEADRFGRSERAMIRAHLYFAVARRYLATNGVEMRFTKKELKQAVQSAMEVVKSTKKPNRDDSVSGRICHGYLTRRLMFWDGREKFADEELVLIRARLYSNVVDRYSRSGFVDLYYTRRELQGAIEFVEVVREQDSRRAQADERDRKIRHARREMGVLAENCRCLLVDMGWWVPLGICTEGHQAPVFCRGYFFKPIILITKTKKGKYCTVFERN